MRGVLAKIRSLYESLPAAERKVADYVLANAERAPHRSVHEFARGGGVSVASVSRFVRKLGFGQLRSFKLELARETAVEVHELFEAITTEDREEDIIGKVFLGNIRGLQDTLKMLSRDELAAAARLVARSRRLVLFGLGGSGHIARDSALRFSYLDYQAEAYTDDSQILLQALRLRPKQVAIGISHSGRSRTTVEGLRIARQKGARTIRIANYMHSPLARVSDLFFCTSFPETRVKVAALSSRLSQLCILDALYLLAALHRNRMWDVEQVNELTEGHTRLKSRK